MRTARLGFGRWTPEDLPLGLSLWGDPEITRFVGGPFTREQVSRRLEKEILKLESYRAQYWPIFLFETGEFVGAAGLRPYKSEERVFALGFYLLREFWRKGLAEEAAHAAIAYAFESLNAMRLFAGHHPNNIVSSSLLAKLGFEFSHEELYPPTGINHPGYFLDRSKTPMDE